MRLSRWVALLAVLVGLGCLQVSQRNAIVLKGYALGERMQRIQTRTTDVAWLNANVIGLTSPTTLAELAQERKLKLVAWSLLAPAHVQGTPELAPALESDERLQLADGR